MTKVERLGAGDQLAAEDRFEGLGAQVGAEAGGDVLGGRVCLLSREPGLLDGKVGAIAGGVDIGDALDPPMFVDRREAPRDRRADP